MTFDRHAIRRSKPAAVAFMANNAVTNFAICAIGAGMSMLIPAAGDMGRAAHSAFAQAVLCGASFVFWASLTVTKLLWCDSPVQCDSPEYLLVHRNYVRDTRGTAPVSPGGRKASFRRKVPVAACGV